MGEFLIGLHLGSKELILLALLLKRGIVFGQNLLIRDSIGNMCVAFLRFFGLETNLA